jgi:hypothetical protein
LFVVTKFSYYIYVQRLYIYITEIYKNVNVNFIFIIKKKYKNKLTTKW